MILISVKSEVMDVKRQYETDKEAEKYLLFIKRFHEMSRLQRMGKRPRPRRNSLAHIHWDNELATCIPLKVEIINTEANQLCIPELLNQTRIIK